MIAIYQLGEEVVWMEGTTRVTGAISRLGGTINLLEPQVPSTHSGRSNRPKLFRPDKQNGPPCGGPLLKVGQIVPA